LRGRYLELLATGLEPPETFTIKGRTTPRSLRAYVKPTISIHKKYPVVNNLPRPQTQRRSTLFSPARGIARPAADWGFRGGRITHGHAVALQEIHEAYFGDMGDKTLPIRSPGMKQLAQRFPWIYIERAASTGTPAEVTPSGGRDVPLSRFFKSGSPRRDHDNREYEAMGRKWQAFSKKDGGTTNYDSRPTRISLRT